VALASGRLILPIAEPILDATGAPASGSVLTFYDAGTSNVSAIFADAALATPIDNPLTADSAGRFYDQATEWWADDSIAYDATIDVAGGSTLTFEDLYVLGAATNTSGFAPIDSPAFTGTPTAPTPASNDNSSKLATTAFVVNQAFAPLNSPALTGTPTAPTAATATNTTQVATTAFVQDALSLTNLASYFTQSLGASGYITLPGGLIVQWATVAPGDDSYVTYTLPTPFTTTNYGVLATVKYNAAKTGGNGGGAFGYPVSVTQVGIGIAWNGDSTGISSVFYVAFGK
jgi:hypothetical protein